MGYIPKEIVAKAKEMDLLTYLRNYEPGELKHVKGNVYQTKSHDSLKISNGKWMWWSEGIGGRSALDYLVKVRDIPFKEAVEMIMGSAAIKEPVMPVTVEETKRLIIPEAADSPVNAAAYLYNKRGLNMEVLNDLYELGIWYETKEYQNVAFVGYDKDRKVRLVTVRGTKGDFKNTTSGSDRKYPVCYTSDMAGQKGLRNSVVHLFEAPIDMISYISLMHESGVEWKNHNFMALCGIYQPKEKLEESAVPAGLKRYLEDRPYTGTVCLHLDNDGAGKNAARAFEIVLGNRGLKVMNQPPPEGFKDCNDFLMNGKMLVRKIRDKEMEGR